MNLTIPRRAGPVFGAFLLVAGMAVALSPVIPTASAIDPTPAPESATPDPGASPTPDVTPTPDPTAAPSVDPSVEPPVDPSPAPTAEPSVDPSAIPTADPSAEPSVDPSATATPDPGASVMPTPEPSATPSPRPGLVVDHFWIDAEDEAGNVASAGTIDDPRIGLQRFTVYRVRFQVLNDADTDASVKPALLVGQGTAPDAWKALPVLEPAPGGPFYAAADKGPDWEVRSAAIEPAALRLDHGAGGAVTPTSGVSSAGKNPAPALDLAAGTYTEVEFLVRATVDAQWDTAYTFRLDLGDGVTSQVDAAVSMGASPPVVLSPGQKPGAPVDESFHELKAPSGGILARLASATVPSAGAATLDAGAFTSPHGIANTLTSDACASCHSTHSAAGSMLLQAAQSPVATLCFSCHDGSGAVADVKAQLTSATLPANNPSTASWYSHPSLAASTHVLDSQNEFGGVNNRHAECVDCHQPHRSDDTLATPTSNGWTVGGAIVGSSGVAVTNGAADTAPGYTFQATNQYEYQLCFKCHSGFTQQAPRFAGENVSAIGPSRQPLDKAIELNPANLSYHPIEAAGKNQTAKMAGSLSGTAPGKLWTFTSTSTVRCANCHGPSTFSNPSADASIDLHASNNRGILLRNYRDRVLKSRTAAYTAVDFSLCYLCHAEAPFVDQSGNVRNDTNFREHGFHVSGIAGGSSTVTDIDTDGAGGGNAICAECHFRVHGSSFAGNAGASPNPGLINFAPNVQTYPLSGGQIQFVQRVGTTAGSCTLTCHGYQHNHMQY